MPTRRMALLTETGLRIIRYSSMADFPFFKMAAVRHLGFLKLKISTSGPVRRQIVHHRTKDRSKSLKLRLRYNNFSIFPRWICSAGVVTTHEGHLVFFITVQNLVGIDAVVLIICTFIDFASLA